MQEWFPDFDAIMFLFIPMSAGTSILIFVEQAFIFGAL